MDYKKLFGVIIPITLIFVGGCNETAKKDRVNNVEQDLTYCSIDKECIKVSEGCCGCNAGGKATAINKNFKDYWENKLEKECKDIMCLQVISDHWTCKAEPKCVNNKCQLETIVEE